MGRDHPLPAFIVGIGALGYIDGLAHLCLGQIVIFPQIPDSLISLHILHQE